LVRGGTAIKTGKFMTKISNRYINKSTRQKLRSNMTKGEKLLWYQINYDKMGFRFRRQFGIGKYIVDFYCPALKLVVEIDGFTHGNETVFANDQIREQYLRSLGLIVKRYNDQEIFNNLDQVLFDLQHTCQELQKTAA
jgi:very-short-patch-repair endonuclease